MLGQPGATRRLRPRVPDGHDLLTRDITDLATRYGRYGYRRITALPRDRGWQVNHKRVERIWRREGLKVPMKQPKRGRLWLNDGMCVRLRPEMTSTHRAQIITGNPALMSSSRTSSRLIPNDPAPLSSGGFCLVAVD